ncbi:hypothetical protein Dda_6101 [Drechslerella dactyloides]|uniref:Uncharacterized protein n=1 Tax=Drechslerella dactyloides TaxID=74499 RepID=A0AAD6IUX4_DREDA|nr:hypothetical protein Dda_6101 [Drechslerella dactyloides]
MSDNTAPTAAKASGVTPATAAPDTTTSTSDQSASKKPNLPASNPDPLPESPSYTPSDSIYPPPAEPAARPAAPTATANNLTEMPAPSERLSSLDDDTTPTRTAATTVNLTDPPPPQPGAFPVSVAPQPSHSTTERPFPPRAGAVPSIPVETSAAAAAATSMPAPSYTMPPPFQSTYSPPDATVRGQPMAGYTSTASSTGYSNYSGGFRHTGSIAPTPGGYQQHENQDVRFRDGEGEAEESLLGKVTKAVDRFNEWMVGGSK